MKKVLTKQTHACVPVTQRVPAERPRRPPVTSLELVTQGAVIPVTPELPPAASLAELGLEGQTERQRAYRTRLDEIRDSLELLPADPGQRRSRRSRWGRHIPKLVFCMFMMISGAPDLFAQLPFSAAELWADKVWIDEAGTQLVMLDGLRAELADTLLARKTRLYERTQTVLGVVQATLHAPVASPEARRRMEQISGDVLKLVEQRRRSRQQASKKKQAILGQAAERVDQQGREIQRLEIENEILRTGTLARAPA